VDFSLLLQQLLKQNRRFPPIFPLGIISRHSDKFEPGLYRQRLLVKVDVVETVLRLEPCQELEDVQQGRGEATPQFPLAVSYRSLTRVVITMLKIIYCVKTSCILLFRMDPNVVLEGFAHYRRTGPKCGDVIDFINSSQV
jgi:hypothetical protein